MSWVVAGIALASALATSYNSHEVAEKQDETAARSILEQSRLQRKADEKVTKQVNELEASTAGDERQRRLGEYMDALRLASPGMNNGLVTNIGSSAFQGDSLEAANDVQADAAGTAGLMARIDAPILQRQGEAFGYGNLATDIGLVNRQSGGQQFLDDLRMKSIRRNPWIDAAAAAGAGYAGAAGAARADGTATGTGSGSGLTYTAPTTRSGDSWLNAYGARR